MQLNFFLTHKHRILEGPCFSTCGCAFNAASQGSPCQPCCMRCSASGKVAPSPAINLGKSVRTKLGRLMMGKVPENQHFPEQAIPQMLLNWHKDSQGLTRLKVMLPAGQQEDKQQCSVPNLPVGRP